MAVNINSQEFADAWRTVFEALLALLQSIGKIVDSLLKKNEELAAPSKTQVGEEKCPTPEVKKTISEERYANIPFLQDDGTYIFKNLKQEQQEGSMYKITIYNDNSCDFELCTLYGEQLQVLKDNKDTLVPIAVGTLHGDITAKTTITTTTKGVGQQDGKQVKILAPMVVELKDDKPDNV